MSKILESVVDIFHGNKLEENIHIINENVCPSGFTDQC